MRNTYIRERRHYAPTGEIVYGEGGKFEKLELVVDKLEMCCKCNKLVDQLYSNYCGNCGAKLDEGEG